MELSDVKNPEDGYVINCYIEPKEGEGPLFDDMPGKDQITARLDGYAIIPMEDYERLKKVEELWDSYGGDI